jgi:hypothetical protein
MYRNSWLYCILFTLVSSFDIHTERAVRIRTASTTTKTTATASPFRHQSSFTLLQTNSDNDATLTSPQTSNVGIAASIDIKKEAVKIFGRLAEKYIALDSSGGNCCYSGCTGCEYRLPDGGYKMADQTAARPKWIPHYDIRIMNTKQHTTKWFTYLYQNSNRNAVTKDEFVNEIMNLEYVPPLGGPYISASAAQITDTIVLQKLFDVLAEDKTKLTKFKMSVRIKQLSDGEEGMTWQAFERMIESSIA